MTASSNPDPAPTAPGSSPSELSQMWRAIGRLEGTANVLLKGQRETKEGRREQRTYFKSAQAEQKAYFEYALREQRTHFESALGEQKAYFEYALREQRTHLKSGMREPRTYLEGEAQELCRRLDRLFYTMLGVGGVVMAAIFASRFIGD